MSSFCKIDCANIIKIKRLHKLISIVDQVLQSRHGLGGMEETLHAALEVKILLNTRGRIKENTRG